MRRDEKVSIFVKKKPKPTLNPTIVEMALRDILGCVKGNIKPINQCTDHRYG